MNAAADFSLCIRRASSCSKHADCARAQFESRNPQRQAFVAPTLTGDACSYFFDFSPFRQLAENGGGIADTLAESENLERSEQSGAASRENAGGSGSAFTIPARNEDRAGTGVEVAGAGPSSATAFLDPISAGEREQLHAARALKL
mgnify:FL=1